MLYHTHTHPHTPHTLTPSHTARWATSPAQTSSKSSSILCRPPTGAQAAVEGGSPQWPTGPSTTTTMAHVWGRRTASAGIRRTLLSPATLGRHANRCCANHSAGTANVSSELCVCVCVCVCHCVCVCVCMSLCVCYVSYILFKL